MIALRSVSPIMAAALAFASPGTASAAQPIEERVQAVLKEAVPGTRFGLVVTTMEGEEVIAIAPDHRFIPASNTKMLTTAAAFSSMTGLEAPDEAGGTTVRLDSRDVVLTGHGDARMSSAEECKVDCLATLADAVAAKTRSVDQVIGNDTLFPDERWSPGMSWNNIQTRSGTAISALTLDNNELHLTVTPNATAGEAAAISGLPYYQIENRTRTGTTGTTAIDYHRMPNSMTVRVTGTIALGASPERLRMGIDDPAHYAAWRMKALLEARGIKVTGAIETHHRPRSEADDLARRGGMPAMRPPEPNPLARLTPPPLIEDLVTINKISQNLHAELLIRRLGLVRGSGSIADGVAEVESMMARAGVPRTAWDLSDGSGMSSYNRLSPRGVAKLLAWIAAQSWGEAYRRTLPIGGVDGTISSRFKGTLLEGKVFAKTGTLNASSALSGYLVTKTGRTLIFSSFANDMPGDGSAGHYIDKALVLIAENY